MPVLLVTHDFGEAALLADRVAVLDAGAVVQTGSATELAARAGVGVRGRPDRRRRAHRHAPHAEAGLTAVDLDGGGRVLSTDAGSGPVAVTVHPWEISVEQAGTDAGGSARNRLPATVTSVTTVGNRVRVGLLGSQPMVAELTGEAAAGLGPGRRRGRGGGLQGHGDAARAPLAGSYCLVQSGTSRSSNGFDGPLPPATGVPPAARAAPRGRGLRLGGARPGTAARR